MDLWHVFAVVAWGSAGVLAVVAAGKVADRFKV